MGSSMAQSEHCRVVAGVSPVPLNCRIRVALPAPVGLSRARASQSGPDRCHQVIHGGTTLPGGVYRRALGQRQDAEREVDAENQLADGHLAVTVAIAWAQGGAATAH